MQLLIQCIILSNSVYVCMYVRFVLGGMFTANTMSSAVETLGMSLPGHLDVLKPSS